MTTPALAWLQDCGIATYERRGRTIAIEEAVIDRASTSYTAADYRRAGYSVDEGDETMLVVRCHDATDWTLADARAFTNANATH